MGSVPDAVNHDLECCLGSQNMTPIQLTECGPEVKALTNVLAKYTHEFLGN